MKSLFRTLVLSAAALVGVSAAIAEGDAIAQRKDVLKGFGDATKPVVGMVKGEAPFDLAAVQKTLNVYIDGAKKLPTLFPDNSKTGGDTAALPKIWDEKAKFDGLFAKLGAESKTALEAIKDEATLKAQFPKLLGNCKACHDDYRQKKS